MWTPIHHSFICEPNINTAETAHLDSLASRSGVVKKTPCQGYQPLFLPKYMHLAWRDIFLLSSLCLLDSLCSSRHSWGKCHISSDSLISKTQHLTLYVGWNAQAHAQVTCLKHCCSSDCRSPRRVQKHPAGTTRGKAFLCSSRSAQWAMSSHTIKLLHFSVACAAASAWSAVTSFLNTELREWGRKKNYSKPNFFPFKHNIYQTMELVWKIVKTFCYDMKCPTVKSMFRNAI